MRWGKYRENGFWLSSTPDWRFLFFGHDALYIAAGRFRMRIMKPSVTIG